VEHYGSTALVQGLTLGIGILTGILSARMLGPVGRGEYAAIIIWPMGIASFVAFGIPQAVVYYLGRREFTRSEGGTAVAMIGLIQSAFCVAIGLLVVPAVLARYSPEVRHLGIIFVLFTPAMLLSGYPASLFQGLQDLIRFNFIRLLAPFLYATGLLGLYFTHSATLRFVIFAQVAGYVVALALGVMLVSKTLKLHVQWNPSTIPRLLSFGSRSQVTSMTYFVNQRIDQLILSLFVPARELGFYAVAVTLSMAVSVFPQAAGIVAFSRGSNQNSADARATIGVAFRASLIWLLACCTALYLLTPFLIRFVFGPAFDGSILACRILLPGALMTGLSYVLYNAASALGRPGLSAWAEGVSVAVTAIGLYVLVPLYGYIGAAIVSSIAYSVSFFVMLALANRLLGLNLRVLLIPGLRNPGN
jgi:O-antigen/teichoic acid export membrane protein